jgi:hypothetical protein
MSSIQEQQLANRRRDEDRKFKKFCLDRFKREIDTSVKNCLTEVFTQWREYKRINGPISVIQKFMRSNWYIIKMRILKKNRREIDSTPHSDHQFDRFITMNQDYDARISESRDLSDNEWTHLRVFLLGFVRTHSPVVDDTKFIQKLREMLNRDEFDYIRNLMGNQSFIQFFESTNKTQYYIRYGCSTPRSIRIYISGLVWILYYLSSERLPKSWFPNPESDFAFVFEELRTIIGQKVQEEEEHHHSGPPYQPDYCSLCGSETIDRICFNAVCVRRRESACASCGNPIEGINTIEVDGMRLHRDCANHNQQTQLFQDYTVCSFCDCSSKDMSFVEGFGFLCHNCVIAQTQ